MEHKCGICGDKTDRESVLFGIKCYLCDRCRGLSSVSKSKLKSISHSEEKEIEDRYIRTDGSIGHKGDKYHESSMEDKAKGIHPRTGSHGKLVNDFNERSK